MRKRLPVKLLAGAMVLGFLLSAAHSAEAQQKMSDRAVTTNNHVIYLELGGTGYFYTVNYERLLFNKSKFALFARLGFEYVPSRGLDKTIHFPVGGSLTWGNRKHRAEVGVAALFRMDFDPGVAFGEGYYFTNPPTRIFLAPSVGYRFHSKPNEWGNSFFLRVTFTPLIGLDVFDDRPYFLPHAGISIGRTWNNPNRKK
ncbi:hypothetical protein ACFLR1_03405 [Bacteroidota bacterium]